MEEAERRIEFGLLTSKSFIFTNSKDEYVQETTKSLSGNLFEIKSYESRPVIPCDVSRLREINSILFPMVYQEKYYREVLLPDSLSRLGN